MTTIEEPSELDIEHQIEAGPAAGGVLTPVATIEELEARASEIADMAYGKLWDAAPSIKELVRRAFTRPTPAAAADLHQRVMNLPCNYPSGLSEDEREAYLIGHRDARHAAAELVAASPAAAADQQQGPVASVEVPHTHAAYADGFYDGAAMARRETLEALGTSDDPVVLRLNASSLKRTLIAALAHPPAAAAGVPTGFVLVPRELLHEVLDANGSTLLDTNLKGRIGEMLAGSSPVAPAGDRE